MKDTFLHDDDHASMAHTTRCTPTLMLSNDGPCHSHHEASASQCPFRFLDLPLEISFVLSICYNQMAPPRATTVAHKLERSSSPPARYRGSTAVLLKRQRSLHSEGDMTLRVTRAWLASVPRGMLELLPGLHINVVKTRVQRPPLADGEMSSSALPSRGCSRRRTHCLQSS
jgi:hypothetical protein